MEALIVSSTVLLLARKVVPSKQLTLLRGSLVFSLDRSYPSLPSREEEKGHPSQTFQDHSRGKSTPLMRVTSLETDRFDTTRTGSSSLGRKWFTRLLSRTERDSADPQGRDQIREGVAERMERKRQVEDGSLEMGQRCLD